jgi:hypothetical protein
MLKRVGRVVRDLQRVAVDILLHNMFKRTVMT